VSGVEFDSLDVLTEFVIRVELRKLAVALGDRDRGLNDGGDHSTEGSELVPKCRGEPRAHVDFEFGGECRDCGVEVRGL
jgi:hypothetical protein